jgi:hypothetical protein
VQDAAALGKHAPRQTASKKSGEGAYGTTEVVKKGSLRLFRATILERRWVCEWPGGAVG